MRADKRKKNAPKELARLKQALSNDKKGEVDMADLEEIATVVSPDKIKKQTDVDMAEDAAEGEWIDFCSLSVATSFHPLKDDYIHEHFCFAHLSWHVTQRECEGL